MAADQADIRADVLSLLQNFRGTDPLKQLFWTKLNYDQVNKPLSRRQWPESVAERLAEDPTLLAAGGKDSDFEVLYARLAKDRLSLTEERGQYSVLPRVVGVDGIWREVPREVLGEMAKSA